MSSHACIVLSYRLLVNRYAIYWIGSTGFNLEAEYQTPRHKQRQVHGLPGLNLLNDDLVTSSLRQARASDTSGKHLSARCRRAPIRQLPTRQRPPHGVHIHTTMYPARRPTPKRESLVGRDSAMPHFTSHNAGIFPSMAAAAATLRLK